MSNSNDVIEAADAIGELMDQREALADRLKMMREEGKALGIDMGAVEQLVKLKRMSEEKRAKLMEKNEALRELGELLEVDPFP